MTRKVPTRNKIVVYVGRDVFVVKPVYCRVGMPRYADTANTITAGNKAIFSSIEVIEGH